MSDFIPGPHAPQDWDSRAGPWLRDACRRLFRDEDLPTEPWTGLARQYQGWAAAGALPPELSPRGHKLGRLALVAVGPLEEATRQRDALAHEDEQGLPAGLAKAIWQRRNLAAGVGDRADGLHRLAEALSQLLPFAGSEEAVQAAVRQVAQVYRRSVEEYLERGDFDGADRVAPSAIGVINNAQVSNLFGVILEWGRRLFLEREHPGPVSLNSLIIGSNLISTGTTLARGLPDQAEHWLGLSTRYALSLLERLDRCTEADPSMRQRLCESGHRGVIFPQMNLLGRFPDRIATIGPFVWRHIEGYETLARESGDPDLCSDVADQKHRVHGSLLEIDRQWTLAHIGDRQDEDPAEALEGLTERTAEVRLRAAEWVSEVLGAGPTEEQDALLDRRIGDCCSRIRETVAVILRETGLNLHVCRVLTALGGIASGRLLPSSLLFTWLFPAAEHEVVPPGHRGKLFKVQNAVARWRMATEIQLYLILTELAVLAEGLQLDPQAGPRLRRRLRAENARLLAGLAVEPQVDRRLLGPAEDLRRLLAGLSPAAVQRTWRAYQSETSGETP